MIHNNKEGKNDKEQNILMSVCKPFIQMDMCPAVRQQILINYLNSAFFFSTHAHTQPHSHTYTHTPTTHQPPHKQLRQNRTIIYLLTTASDTHDKAKKKKKNPILLSFSAGYIMGLGAHSFRYQIPYYCRTIYSSCYSSTSKKSGK